MDDAFVVGVRDGFGDLASEGERLVDGDGAGGDAFGEGRAVDQLDDEGSVFKSVDGADVGVVEGGEDLGFASEAGETVGIGGEGFGEELDGDLAAEFGIGGAPDFAHAALAEFGGDAVMGDGRTRGHGVHE
jgi:hypothetical protein